MSDPLSSLPPRPVMPLQYRDAPASSRPGLVTAIGVISIVVAVLSFISSGVLGLQAFGLYMVSRMAGAMAVPPPAVTVPAMPATGPAAKVSIDVDDFGFGGARGMRLEERGAVVDGLARLRPLSPIHRRQLRALLAKAGKDVLTLPPDDLRPQVIAAAVSSSGPATPSVEGDPPGHFFVFARGRIEVFDDEAVFLPRDQQREVRVSAGMDSSKLAPAQVEAVVARVQQLCNGRATPAQLNTLRQELTASGQGLVTPGATAEDAAAQVSMAMPLGNGNLGIYTTNGSMLQLDSQGRAIQKVTATAGGTAVFATAGPGMFPKVSPASFSLALAESALSAALAILLFVAAILVFRTSRYALRLHRIYAVAKFLIASTGGFIWGWFWWEFFGSVSPAGGGPPATAAVTMGIVLAVLGCAYPVGLLIALRSRVLRDYFALNN